jgi:hypothetical protein
MMGNASFKVCDASFFMDLSRSAKKDAKLDKSAAGQESLY